MRHVIELLPERAFRARFGRLETLEGGGKGGSSPPPPDYAGAAEATAAGNAEAARIAAKANRISQYTPYGSVVYTPGVNGDQDQWRADVQLSPEQKQLLDQQNKTSVGLAGLQDQGLSYVKNMLDKPFDQGALPAQQINPGQTAQDAIMSRLQPTWNAKQSALETQLANQGIARGTEAYANALREFGNSRNDAEMQAALQGINVGQQARQQGIQEQAFFRNEPLNTLNAVRTGAQVTNPQFTNAPQQQTAQGANYMDAAKAQGQYDLGTYNADLAAQNSQAQGMYGIGSAALMAFAI